MFVKRFLDVALASIALIALSPLMLLLAIAIKLDSKGPIFFLQNRVGKDGKVFPLLKFRSMVHGAAKVGLGFEVASDDDRITRIGRFIRVWALDELPQFINVVKGDLSLIGPRAARVDQVEEFNERELGRLAVRPGVSGWAAVNGRNLISWKDRIELDLWYIEHRSLTLDIKIVFKTFWVLATREGAYGPDGVTRDYNYQ